MRINHSICDGKNLFGKLTNSSQLAGKRSFGEVKFICFILFEYPAACCGWDGTIAERR